jgi:hypothetical protein
VANGTDTTPVYDEAFALHIMVLIGHAFYFDEPKLTLETLAARGCCGSPDQIEALLRCLRAAHLIVATGDEPEAHLPARPLEKIDLEEVVAAVRAHRVQSMRFEAIQLIVDQIDAAVAGCLKGKNLRDLVLAVEKSPMSFTLDPEQSGQ